MSYGPRGSAPDTAALAPALARMLKSKAFVIVPAAIVALGALLVGYEARAWLRARRELHPERAPVTPAERARASRELPGFEEVTFPTRDGLHLSGWFKGGSRRDAVVLVHGLGGNRASLLGVAAVLASSGHGVLTYDSRASGESEGTVATWGDREQLDVEGALDFVSRRPEVRADRLGLYGFSVGATTVALVAARDRRVAAVALGPTWTSLGDELKNKFGKWGLLSLGPAELAFRSEHVAIEELRPIDVVASIPPRPLFMLSGANDTDTPPAVMEELHRRVPKVEYWIVPGVGHGGYEKVAPAEFRTRFGGFFDRAFPPA
ncbi:MAG TPA: alpha/beta fold hydrolase [Polyangiaceae bacterium]|nr:alpha/beta fold hydrolase [Polyangiaceae bacterium]